MTVKKQKTILLVEDEAAIAAQETQRLKTQGYNVLHAPNGEKAVDAVRERKGAIDLVLMDVDLGQGIDGAETAQMILKDRKIPILFLLNPTEPEMVEKIENVVSYGCVAKDSGITILDAAIKMALKRFAVNQRMYNEAQSHKQAVEALQNSEERFRALYESMTEGVCRHEIVYGPAGKAIDYRIIDTNPQYEKILDLNKNDVIGRLATDIYQTDEAPYLETYAEVAQTGKPFRFETYFPPMDKHFSISVFSPGKDRFASVFQDITERKKAEEVIRKAHDQLEQRVGERTRELAETNASLLGEISKRKQAEDQMNLLVSDLKRANQELQDFSYIVSHDLKAPMRGISSVAGWLKEDYAEVLDEAGNNYLDKLQIRTNRMHHLIEGILQYSRVGRTAFVPTKFNCADVFHDIIDGLSPPEAISLNIREPLPDIIYDKLMFMQVLQNLISNGIKHLGKPEGQIMVSCTDIGGCWEFCVEDNGVGIEERHFQRIFKMFQSLKPHSETDSSGIGLALVKKIIERFGGAVRLESTVGKGSAFFFTIPKNQRLITMRRTGSVLIIDENADFLDAAAEMLQLRKCNVLAARNGKEAFDILESHDGIIHTALMDVIIPGEDAVKRYNTLRELRPEMKIIICTENIHAEAVKKLEREGADGVLAKPFKIDEFFAVLQKCLKPL